MESGLFPTTKPSGKWWRDHSLSLVVGLILAAQTVLALWLGHDAWVSDGRDHGQALSGWGGEFWRWWGWEYNVSLVADTYGVLLIVVLSKWLRERGSTEG